MALGWIVDFTTQAAQESTNNHDTVIFRPQTQQTTYKNFFGYLEHRLRDTMPSASTYIKAISGYIHNTAAV
jgi:hypothetical protein